MNDQELKNMINKIRLPEESRERIIRNLERIQPEEYVSDIEPVKPPILRYMMTAIAACAVLAVTAGGVYISHRGGFNPASEVVEDREAIISNGFDFSESALFAVMGVDMEILPESVTYQAMTDEQKTGLSEIFNSLDWENPVQDWEIEYDESDTCHLFFQHEGVWYALQTIKDGNDQCWIQWMQHDTITLQTDSAVIEEIRNIVTSDSLVTSTVPMNYLDAVHHYPLTYFVDLVCCDTAYNDIISLGEELDADNLNACFMTRNPDDLRNDAKYSGEYFVMNAEQKQEFSELLLRQYFSDLHMEFSAGGRVSDVLYLENGTYLEFWEDSDCILVHNPETLPNETFAIDIDSDAMEQFLTLFDSFKGDSKRVETDHLNHETLMEQMFTQDDTAPFGDISQMDLRCVFVEYAPCYMIPTDEQKTQLAELLNHYAYEKRVNKTFFSGQYFTLWLDDHGERKEIICSEEGYIGWEEGIGRYTYEAEELIQEIKNLFIPADIVYITNESGDVFDPPKEEIKIDYSEYDLSAYVEVLDEYNQEHPDYQLHIDEDILNGSPYEVTMFLREYPAPEVFMQKALEIYDRYASNGLEFSYASD